MEINKMGSIEAKTMEKYKNNKKLLNFLSNNLKTNYNEKLAKRLYMYLEVCFKNHHEDKPIHFDKSTGKF